jgi:hypothetical protein
MVGIELSEEVVTHVHRALVPEVALQRIVELEVVNLHLAARVRVELFDEVDAIGAYQGMIGDQRW